MDVVLDAILDVFWVFYECKVSTYTFIPQKFLEGWRGETKDSLQEEDRAEEQAHEEIEGDRLQMEDLVEMQVQQRVTLGGSKSF